MIAMQNNAMYLVIDMINDLLHPDGVWGGGALAQEAARRGIVANTRAAIAGMRRAGVRIGFVRVAYSSDYRERPRNSPSFENMLKTGGIKLDTWGTQIHGDLGLEPQDFLITKHRMSAFYGTELELLLRSHGITDLFVSGITTTAGVQSAVRDAHDRDYRVCVIEDCCASVSQAEHEASIAMLGRFVRIASAEEAVAAPHAGSAQNNQAR
jgi:nicotinamidase-related amidase